MGQLIPEDFPMELLKNEAERVVVDCFARTLFSNWLVVPDVGMRTRMVSQERALHMARPSDVKLLEQAGESKLLSDQAH